MRDITHIHKLLERSLKTLWCLGSVFKIGLFFSKTSFLVLKFCFSIARSQAKLARQVFLVGNEVQVNARMIAREKFAFLIKHLMHLLYKAEHRRFTSARETI